MKIPDDVSGSRTDRLDRIWPQITPRQGAIYFILDLIHGDDGDRRYQALLASLMVLGCSAKEMDEVCRIGIYIDNEIVDNKEFDDNNNTT